jgi:hypothetical protein
VLDDDDPNLDRDARRTSAEKPLDDGRLASKPRCRRTTTTAATTASPAKDDGRSLRARAGVFARVDAGGATRDAARAVETRTCV